MSGSVVDRIAEVLRSKGQRRYGLENVSQLQHALQAAWLAEQAGDPDTLIAAALLHDIGHLTHDLGENPAAKGVDDRHEEVGHAVLSGWFGPAVTEPVRLHVAAKRYLCAVEPSYFGTLAPDSVRSLALQGGPMQEVEASAFGALQYSGAAVRLRRYDEAAKDPAAETPDLEHFLSFVAACTSAGSPRLQGRKSA